MVAEQSTLRVTAEPFIPKVPAASTPSAASTPLKKVPESATTPSKTYKLRELSADEIAAKSIRPSPVRQTKTAMSPIATPSGYESPLPFNVNQLRNGKNSCTKLHCKRCAYREMAKGDTRRELEFVKEHDENCVNQTPVLPRALSRTSKENEAYDNNDHRSSSRSISASNAPRIISPIASQIVNNDNTSNVLAASPPTNVVSPLAASSPSSSSSVAATYSSVASASAPQSQTQQLVRAGLLVIVAILLVLLLAQRSGVWKSTLRAVAAAVVAAGTVVLAPAAIASHR